MYNLPYFKETDHQMVLDFIRQHPFAMLIGSSNNLPVATQVPVFIEKREGKLFLKGHIMRNTDHHKSFIENENVLCVFTGPHTYVSASWYSNPQTASTWNYMSVHAKGKLSFVGQDDLLKLLNETTTHFENNPSSPASFENLPDEYVQKLIKAIVGFEIEVTSIDNVFKLSQNRDQQSYQEIIRQLSSQKDGKEIAEEMIKREGKLFG
jgi:transcriptional regulator